MSAGQSVSQPFSQLVNQQAHVSKLASQTVSQPISQLVNQQVHDQSKSAIAK